MIDEAEERHVQNCVVTFDDGTKAIFSGKAVCFPGTQKRITDIKFTEPKPIPDNYSWGTL